MGKEEIKFAEERMVNEEKLLTVVKRQFKGTENEVLSELVQNAVRAGAKKFFLETTENGLRFADDGKGLGGTVEDFAPTVKLAESSYDSETVENQDPMGVGLFSLFALDEVTKVKILSAGLQLTVDTGRLWNEKGYWQKWRVLVSPAQGANQSGLIVEIECSEKVANGFKNCLKSPYEVYRGYNLNLGKEIKYNYDKYDIAAACADLLEIFIDGEPVIPTFNPVSKFNKIIADTVYEGNRLIIGYGLENPLINWYGQYIRAEKTGGIKYYYEVRQGKPVTPMSPTRQGLKQDAKSAALRQFVLDSFRDYILNAPTEQLSAGDIEKYYLADAARANDDCPYFIVREVDFCEDITSTECFEHFYGKFLIARYDDENLLLTDLSEIRVFDDEGNDYEDFGYGARSFIPQIKKITDKKICSVAQGNPQRLDIQKVVWEKGKQLNDEFYEAGKFALTSKDFPEYKSDEYKNLTWHKIEESPVFAFLEGSAFDYAEIETVYVGIKSDDIGEKLRFYEKFAKCLFDYRYSDTDTDGTEFDDSLEYRKSRLFDDCISDDSLNLFSLKYILGFKSEDNIVEIKINYPKRDDGKPDSRESVEVLTDTGKSVKKFFLDYKKSLIKQPE